MKTNNSKSLLQKWLDTLQQESWQLELLISGFAIFGLFELKEYLIVELQNVMANPASKSAQMLIIGKLTTIIELLSTYILIINLLIHVLVRGLWIGAIGLRYVSQDIDYDKLKYSERFIKFYKQSLGSFDDYIVSLEKFASIIFSFTFLLLFALLSSFLILLELMMFKSILETWGIIHLNLFLKIIIITFLVFAALVAFDFLTLGLLKRIKQRHLSKMYFIIYRIIGFASLSFIWRPLLLNFLDQKYTKRLLLLIIPYVFTFVIYLPNIRVSEYSFYPTGESFGTKISSVVSKHSFYKAFYDSFSTSNEVHIIKNICIPDYKVSGQIFEVFIKFRPNTDEYILYRDSSLFKIAEAGYKNITFGNEVVSSMTSKYKKALRKEKLDSIKNIYPNLDSKRIEQINDSLETAILKIESLEYEQNLIAIKKFIKESILLSIDGNPIPQDSFSCDFHVHPNAKEKGMLCFFKIDLEIGRHDLEYKNIGYNKKQDMLDTSSLTVPFIYLGK